MTHAPTSRAIIEPLDTNASPILDGGMQFPSANARGCGSHSDPRWFAVQTHVGSEEWAEANLKRQGYATFLPMVTERRQDRVIKTMWRNVPVVCFPSYLFVRFCPRSDPWRPIVSTRGVKRLFCSRDAIPTPIRRGEVEDLIKKADARSIVLAELPAIAEGVALTVTAGPFADREGVCLWSSETRTRLLMDVLGASVVVEVARGAVRSNGG